MSNFSLPLSQIVLLYIPKVELEGKRIAVLHGDDGPTNRRRLGQPRVLADSEERQVVVELAKLVGAKITSQPNTYQQSDAQAQDFVEKQPADIVDDVDKTGTVLNCFPQERRKKT